MVFVVFWAMLIGLIVLIKINRKSELEMERKRKAETITAKRVLELVEEDDRRQEEFDDDDL